MSARIAGLAILVAELSAGLSSPDGLSKPVAWGVFFALQLAAIVWITDGRSWATLRLAIPPALAGVSAAAVWTSLAFAAPVVATGNLLALVAIAAAGGLVVAVWPRRRTGQRLLPAVLIASSSAALMILLAISSVMPLDNRFVSTTHPPVWPVKTRLVDPILEVAIFVLLALAFGADQLRNRLRRGRAAGREGRALDLARPNEMIVEPADFRPFPDLPS
jgi:hypothetical protein